MMKISEHIQALGNEFLQMTGRGKQVKKYGEKSAYELFQRNSILTPK
jgi:hypothetical protein